MQRFAELLSSGLTVVTIALSSAVVYYWFESTKNIIQKKKKLNSENWFILGVFFGFLGETLDNLYWLLPWTSAFLVLPETEALMNFGVFVNIPVRQGLGTFAAYCHIRAAIKYHNRESEKANKILHYASLGGIAYSSALIIGAD